MKHYVIKQVGVLRPSLAVTTNLNAAVKYANHLKSASVHKAHDLAELAAGKPSNPAELIYLINEHSGVLTDKRGVLLPAGHRLTEGDHFTLLGQTYQVADQGVEAVRVYNINTQFYGYIYQNGEYIDGTGNKGIACLDDVKLLVKCHTSKVTAEKFITRHTKLAAKSGADHA